MRTSIAIGILLSASLWGTPALSAQAVSANRSVEAEFRALMAERKKANLEGDTQKIESLMADEYVQTDIVGRVQNKSEWLADYFRPLADLIKAGKFRWDEWDEHDVQVRTLGDTVVVVGGLTLKGSGASYVPGRGWVASPERSIGPTTLRFTRVYIKRNGKWLIAAVHNALLPAEGKR